MSQNIIAAIDAGHGHTKWILQIGNRITSEGAFPSLTPQAGNSGIVGSGLSKLRVIAVPVKDRTFHVGQDSYVLSDGRHEERQRTPDYCTTDAYHALNIAALASMGQPVIDILVIGLPLSNILHFRTFLESRYTGRHEVPMLTGMRGELTTVDVRRVLVMPQPGGALVATASENPELTTSKNLVVDMGFHTLDFLFTHGKRPYPERSGAVEGGMSEFIDALHAAVAKEYAKAFPEVRLPLSMPHHCYEEALLAGRTLRTGAGDIDLTTSLQIAARKLDQYLDVVATRVRNTGDIQNVVISGGGAGLLAPRFKLLFPQLHNVFMPRRPQFSIVEGFLAAGASYASRSAA